MSRDSETDPIFERIAQHVGRILYTAHTLETTPQGFDPAMLMAMGADLRCEVEMIWRLMGYTDVDLAGALEAARSDAAQGLELQWKPEEPGQG